MSVTFCAAIDSERNALRSEELEGPPSLVVWGSWGGHRCCRRLNVPVGAAPSDAARFGPFLLPTAAEVRGDEHVWLSVMGRTHHSGEDVLDRDQGAWVWRDVFLGLAALPLRDLVAAAASGRRMHVPFRQNHLLDMEASDKAYAHRTFKGFLLLDVRGEAAVLPQPAPGAGLLFGSEALRAANAAMCRMLTDEYDQQFDSRERGAWKPVDEDKGAGRFAITQWQSDAGVLPPVAYLQHDMFGSRAWPARCDFARHAPLYASTPADAAAFEQGLRATWVGAGVSVDASLAAVRQQLAQAADDARLRPDFVRVMQLVTDFAREHAQNVRYTRDYYYPNATDFDDSDSVAAAATAPPDAADAEPVGTENWSTTPITGASNAGDCDECGMVIHEVLEALGKFTLGAGADADADLSAYPLLQAVRRVLALMMPCIVQGLVTTAFVDTNGAELAADQIKTLPKRHSPEFRAQHSGGHFWAMWLGRALVADLLRAAGHAVDEDLPQLAPRPRAFEKALPVLVLEGTGMTDPYLLPIGELGELLTRDTASAAAMVAAEKARQRQWKTLRTKAPTLYANLKLYAPPTYIAKQDVDQSLSPFYRYVTQMQSNTLYQMNPLYGHLKPVHVKRHEHGHYVPDLLRAPFSADRGGLGLRAIYADVGRARWEAVVAPVMAAVQNQLPMSIVGRAHAPAVAGTTLLPPVPASHTMTTTAVVALARVPLAQQTAALDRYATGLARHLAAGAGAGAGSSGSGSTTGLNLALLAAAPRIGAVASTAASVGGAAAAAGGGITAYLEPWVLAKTDVRDKIRAEIDQLQKTGEMTWVRTRRLPQADDVINVHFEINDV